MLPQTLPTEAHLIAPDTFLIPTLAVDPSGGGRLLRQHPGDPRRRAGGRRHRLLARCATHWLDTVFSVVDPADVRWVFISHDDHDHIGNLEAVLDLCPQATLVGQLGDDRPPHGRRGAARCTGCAGSTRATRFDAGDRTLHLVRPPLFDSPATRGLFDPTTGVLWAVDTFGAHGAGRRSSRPTTPTPTSTPAPSTP